MNVSISEQDIDYAELRNDIRNYIAFRKKSWNVETKSLEEQRTTLTTLLQDLIKIILKTNYSCYDLVLAKKVYENLKDLIDDFLVSSVPPKKCDYVKEGWTNWLTVERKNAYSWKYSNRYFQYLAGQKGWSLQSITSLNFTTDDILSHCGDPNSPFDFCVKGLVIGDIQSGKTGNYTSLINKAIDAGYKFIIVLTGTTNDLRAQTQKRLEKEVV
ncbi:MAG TPA: hypothetical protein DD377_02450, partial [Firmicutes bacterium]|nr:hypothetical protein [Bacillota bacterium]